MNHDSYSDNYIRGILNTVKTISMGRHLTEGEQAQLFCVQIFA
jgi:hypothetical protein